MIQELYKFERYANSGDASPTDTWTYTSSDTGVTYDSNTYASTIMGRGGISLRTDSSKNSVDVSFEHDNSFMLYWRTECEFSTLILTIIEKNDTTYTQMFKGKFYHFSGPSTMYFESDYSLLRRVGTGKVHQHLCGHTLYDQSTFNCGVDKSLFAVSATITDISSTTLEILEAAGYDDHWFTFGMIIDGDGNWIYVTSQIGDVVKVSKLSQYVITDFATNGHSDVTIYPGCTKARKVCDEKFDNISNYGGEPFKPGSNPWDTFIIV